MPRHRRIGNALLSQFQNRVTGAELSEWHTGMRAYRVDTVARLDLAALPAGFDFDTAITLALLSEGARIAEVPIATYYGDEAGKVLAPVQAFMQQKGWASEVKHRCGHAGPTSTHNGELHPATRSPPAGVCERAAPAFRR